MDDETIDGCELDFAADAIEDTDIDMVVLFADCEHQDQVDEREREWAELLA